MSVSAPVDSFPSQSIERSLLKQTGRTRIYTHEEQVTVHPQQAGDRCNRVPITISVVEVTQEMIGTLWHPQEANANLQPRPSAHTGILSAAPVKSSLLSWRQYGTLPLTSRCLPPSLPPRSLLPPHMPGHQLLKQIRSDCSNESSSQQQQPYT